MSSVAHCIKITFLLRSGSKSVKLGFSCNKMPCPSDWYSQSLANPYAPLRDKNYGR